MSLCTLNATVLVTEETNTVNPSSLSGDVIPNVVDMGSC